MKKTVIKYSVTALIGAVIVVAVGFLNSLYKSETATQVLSRLSDGFFIAGVVIAGIGGLILSYNEGIIDGLTYGMHSLFGFRSLKRDSTPKKENFYEYRKRKHAKKVSVKHLFLVGLAYILIGVILFVVYYTTK